jgi:hypothetical protein
MMSMDEFRTEMREYREDAQRAADEQKDTYLVLDRLHSLYRRFDANERAMADQVLCEWVLSDDETIRFDAMVLINDLRITQSVPALKELAKRLASSSAPGAPFEIKKINRIVAALADPKIA